MSFHGIDYLLNQIVKGQFFLDGIIVVDLATSCVLNHSPVLKKNIPDVYAELIGDYGVSEAFSSFGELAILPKIFNGFATSLKFGDSQYVVVKFSDRFILIHFNSIEALPIAVCYLGTAKTSANALIRAYKRNNRRIILAIKDFFS
jgi:hypothetical protein